MYFNGKKRLISQIKLLKNRFNIVGIKAEFEAEGSTFDDITNLRLITEKCNTKLFVKIGGVEAINDINKCLEIGVDGIIAPMVESKFAATKFIDYFKKIKIQKNPHLSINIETKTGYENFDEIIKETKNYINNITIGRSDLSKSYFNKKIFPDSDFISDVIIKIAKKIRKNNITLTVGGSVSNNTIKIYKEKKNLLNLIDKIETRKVIMTSKSIVTKNAVHEALNFEKLYILSKNEINNFRSSAETNRLTILSTRK